MGVNLFWKLFTQKNYYYIVLLYYYYYYLCGVSRVESRQSTATDYISIQWFDPCTIREINYSDGAEKKWWGDEQQQQRTLSNISIKSFYSFENSSFKFVVGVVCFVFSIQYWIYAMYNVYIYTHYTQAHYW